MKTQILGVMDTQVRNLARDDAGNFTYVQTDGSPVTVFASSDTAKSFESLWSTCGEIFAAELAKRDRNEAGRKTGRPFLSWLRSLFSRTSRPRIPAIASRPTTMILPLKAQPKAFVPASPAPTKAGQPAPSSIQPVELPARVAPSALPTFTVKSLTKNQATGEYRIIFSEGIDVRVPPDSPYAQKFDRCFKEVEKIRLTMDLIEPAKPIHLGDDFSVTSPDAKPLSGKIITLGRSTNSKPRFAIESEGRFFPLPLTDRETKVVAALLEKHKDLRVHGMAEVTSLVSLESVEIKGDDGRIQEKRFRDLLKASRTKKAQNGTSAPQVDAAPAQNAAPTEAPTLTWFENVAGQIRAILKNPNYHPLLFELGPGGTSQNPDFHVQAVDVEQPALDRILVTVDVLHEHAPGQDESLEEVAEAEFITGPDGLWRLSDSCADNPAAKKIAALFGKELPAIFTLAEIEEKKLDEAPPNVGGEASVAEESSVAFENLPPSFPVPQPKSNPGEAAGKVIHVPIPTAEEVDAPGIG